MKIVKTAEDGKIAGIPFTITGNGVNETVQTNGAGVIQIDNLAPGVYTVSEQSFDEYKPQESRQVTVVSGQTATVTFNNTLRRGDLVVTKTAEDGLVEGVKFHLYGTSLSGAPVDEYAVTDRTGRAYFRNVLIGTGYILEEMDVPVRYVVPDSQSAAIEWNTVTRKTFENRLKKWNATVTKRDGETGGAQGDGSLAGAVYGVYQGDKLIDTYTTNATGQFTTDYYPCGDNWSIREVIPSEGYLLDTTSHRIGAEPRRYTAEYNSTSLDVTEQIIKGNIALIKHTDNGDTQLETPEVGAEFVVYLKSAGSYEAARKAERDHLVCDENGFAQTKDLPYGVYTVHQVSGWDSAAPPCNFLVFLKGFRLVLFRKLCGSRFRQHIQNQLQCSHIITEVLFFQALEPFILSGCHSRPCAGDFIGQDGVFDALLNTVSIPFIRQFFPHLDCLEPLVDPFTAVSLSLIGFQGPFNR